MSISDVKNSLSAARDEKDHDKSNAHIDLASAHLKVVEANVSRDKLAAALPSLTAMISSGTILLTNLIGGSKTSDMYQIVLGAIGLILIIAILWIIIKSPDSTTSQAIGGAVWVMVSIVTAYLGSTQVAVNNTHST